MQPLFRLLKPSRSNCWMIWTSVGGVAGQLSKRGRWVAAESRPWHWPRACRIAQFEQESKSLTLPHPLPSIGNGLRRWSQASWDHATGLGGRLGPVDRAHGPCVADESVVLDDQKYASTGRHFAKPRIPGECDIGASDAGGLELQFA